MILSKTQYNDNQMFHMVNAVEVGKTQANGTYNMAVGALPSKSIEVAGSSTRETMQQSDIWSYGNAKAQKFEIEYVDGFY